MPIQRNYNLNLTHEWVDVEPLWPSLLCHKIVVTQVCKHRDLQLCSQVLSLLNVSDIWPYNVHILVYTVSIYIYIYVMYVDEEDIENVLVSQTVGQSWMSPSLVASGTVCALCVCVSIEHKNDLIIHSWNKYFWYFSAFFGSLLRPFGSDSNAICIFFSALVFLRLFSVFRPDWARRKVLGLP